MTPEQFHAKAQRAAEWWCEHIGTAWHDSFYKWMVREHGHVVGNDIAITDRMMIAMAEDRDWQDTEPADEVEWVSPQLYAEVGGYTLIVSPENNRWEVCDSPYCVLAYGMADSVEAAKSQAIAAAKGLGEKG